MENCQLFNKKNILIFLLKTVSSRSLTLFTKNLYENIIVL
ncbi:hypothetical protein DU19_0343 [Chlamydia muridarum]|nr:hypothetical protein DU17_0345 [Chlamydia muridarum]KDU81311.1 hypothetical protein DU18_0345 [Chlamydia muridarum]KDU82229.1 hypothetical protein DU19_0343 [Chlamydia muridarum]KDU83263.1 hypothetical protein DU20_0343 [Chlamydia muridarum]KDU84775.1 hypothetical protein DU21_0345 [Chlamydia muridarum]